MNAPSPSHSTAPTSHLIIAFAVLYLVWGSTYLGMAVAIETMPPLAMASVRFASAGALLMAVLRLTGTPMPTATQWRSAAITGSLLFLGGNGLVCWAQQIVPTGITALLIGATPLWMTMLPWFAGRSPRPRAMVLAGIALGIAGVVVLIGAPAPVTTSSALVGAMLVLILATMSWALGSLSARVLPLPASPWMSSATQMLCGAVGLGLASVLMGEHLHADHISLRSWVAFGYLVLVGSIMGFGAYVYLLQRTTMAKVSTYAFVNPVVAVVLGWLVLGEPITLRTLAAGMLIIAAVVLILRPAPRVA
jgi:drug/metabolite transporter (DMT)-like permease